MLDPDFLEEENSRVLTMVTAMYVRTLYPDLTVTEIFEKLEDVEFVKSVINHIVEELNANLS